MAGPFYVPMTIDIEQLGLDDGSTLGVLLRRFYIDLLRRAWSDAEDTLSIDLAFDVEHPRVQDTLAGLLLRARGMAETTRNDIRALVGKQAEEGWSVERLADEIRAAAKTSSVRAELIARTESARAFSLGSQLAWQASGVVAQQEWLVADPCPICKPLNGKQVPLGAEFGPGVRVPGDTHPGCKCALAPIIS